MVLVGWIVMAVLAVLSRFISDAIVVGGTTPIDAMMVGIILGAIARNVGWVPQKWLPYLKKFETPLLIGVIALGAGFTVKVASELPLGLIVIFVTLIAGFFIIYFFARRLKLPSKMSALLGVGTCICGGSAIAITAPLIKAKEEETSYAVSTIVIAAFILLIALPFLGNLMGLSQDAFGVWAGTAVHNTPQTIATGYIFGDEAGQITTAIKLTRNMFMIVAAVAVSIWFSAKAAREAGTSEKKIDKKALLKAFPWFLFGYIAMAIFAVNGFFTPEGVTFFKAAGKFLILMGMVGIGFGTDFRHVKRFGVKPLVVGIVGAIVVSGISLLTVNLLSI